MDRFNPCHEHIDAIWEEQASADGVPSCFVIKDEYDNRYGEYCLSSITIPCPINPDLWIYLTRELVENIK